MTEEELNQKAKNVYIRCFDDDFKYQGVLHALEMCIKETAEELEKTIKLLGERCNQLLKDKGELIDKVEKMKCCGNCKNYAETYGLCCYSLGDEDYFCRLRKWELKE